MPTLFFRKLVQRIREEFDDSPDLRMTVTEAHERNPEAASRQRAWESADEAIDRVDDPGLRDLLRRLFHADHPDQLSVG